MTVFLLSRPGVAFLPLVEVRRRDYIRMLEGLRGLEQGMPSEVKDNPAHGRFELEVDGHPAFVSYRLTKSAVVLVHTEVPKALEGHGIGTALATGVLELL